jgi:hypothetical protein
MVELKNMRSLTKVAVVFFGFVLALAIACIALKVYVARTAGPDREQYAAMFAFGDSLLFLGIFGVAAVPALSATLYFLRPHPSFWRLLSIATLAVSVTSIAASIAISYQRSIGSSRALSTVFALASLEALCAPAFVVLFLLFGIFAPSRSARVVFAAATLAEAFAFLIFLFPRLQPH